MKRAVFIATIVVAASAGVLRADPWQKTVDANLNLTQNAYSNNWIGGEAGSVSWMFNSNALFERQFGARINSRNTLKLFFGQTHSQDEKTKSWLKPLKTTDRIDFETVFRFTTGRLVDPYASGRMESQFIDQSDPSNERPINPILFTESLGAAKVITKTGEREWTARIGGGFRQHLDRSAIDPVSLAKQTKTTNDGGILFVSDFTAALADSTMRVTSRLSVYKAFYYSESKKLEGRYNMDYWKSPDLDWENIFTASIAKYLAVNLYVQFLYDKEVDLAGRFRQSLSLGLTYKLM
jgi:hypothetical protein